MSGISYEYYQADKADRKAMNAANHSGTLLSVLVVGTLIPLPKKTFLNGFTANAGNNVFTAANAGLYSISYDINITVALGLSATVLINGTAKSELTRTPSISINSFSATSIVTLNQGDTLSLQVYGLLGAATLQSGQGAQLTAIKID